MRRKSLRLLAAFTCTALLVAACSDDEEKSEDTTAGTTADTRRCPAYCARTMALPNSCCSIFAALLAPS